MNVLRLSPLDALYGATKVLHGIWFFRTTLDPGQLQESLHIFAKRYPSFSSRIIAHRRSASPFCGYALHPNGEIPLHIVRKSILGYDEVAYPDPALHVGNHSHLYDPPTGLGLLSLVPSLTPHSVFAGDRPVLELQLTQFQQGGSAIGVAISHGVVDAKGMHLVMSNILPWSNVRRTDQLVESRECLENMASFHEDDADDGGLDLTGLRGRALWWCLRRMDSQSLKKRSVSDPRSYVRWNQNEWVGTGAAIQQMVDALPSSSVFKQHPFVHLRTVVDLRTLNVGIPKTFTGNAVQTVTTSARRHDLARGWRTLVERLRNDDEVRQAIVNVFFRNMSSLERGFLVDGDLHVDTGYSNISSPEESATILSINSQIQTVSGARDVVKFVPGISDHFQFVPSFHENGDVECWVNVKHRRESECTIEQVSK